MKWHVIKFARSALSEPYRDAGKILEKVFVLCIGLAKDKILMTKYILTFFVVVVFSNARTLKKKYFSKKSSVYQNRSIQKAMIRKVSI